MLYIGRSDRPSLRQNIQMVLGDRYLHAGNAREAWKTFLSAAFQGDPRMDGIVRHELGRAYEALGQAPARLLQLPANRGSADGCAAAHQGKRPGGTGPPAPVAGSRTIKLLRAEREEAFEWLRPARATTEVPSGVERDLEAVVAKGRVRLRVWAAKQALQSAFRWLYAAALVVPCVALIGTLTGLAGAAVWPLGVAATVLLALAAPFAFVACHALVLFLRDRIDRRVCLALFDRALGLKDRLQAADEFLLKADPPDERRDADRAFELAAIEDAAGHAKQALDSELSRLKTAPIALRPRHWPLGAAAVVVLGAALLLGQIPPGLALEQGIPDALPNEFAVAAVTTDQDNPDPPQPKTATRRALADGERVADVAEPTADAALERPRQSETGTGSARASSAKSSRAVSLANQAGRAAAGASGEGAQKREERDARRPQAAPGDHRSTRGQQGRAARDLQGGQRGNRSQHRQPDVRLGPAGRRRQGPQRRSRGRRHGRGRRRGRRGTERRLHPAPDAEQPQGCGGPFAVAVRHRRPGGSSEPTAAADPAA